MRSTWPLETWSDGSWNQAFFEKLFVTDDCIGGANLASPFRQVMDDRLDQNIEAENKLSAQDLLKMLAETNLNYERPSDEEVSAEAVEVHPVERPNGLLPVDE